MPISSASMSGWWNGATMTLVPSLRRALVRCAMSAMFTSGFGAQY